MPKRAEVGQEIIILSMNEAKQIEWWIGKVRKAPSDNGVQAELGDIVFPLLEHAVKKFKKPGDRRWCHPDETDTFAKGAVSPVVGSQPTLNEKDRENIARSRAIADFSQKQAEAVEAGKDVLGKRKDRLVPAPTGGLDVLAPDSEPEGDPEVLEAAASAPFKGRAVTRGHRA